MKKVRYSTRVTNGELKAMHLSRSLQYAVRFSYAQNGVRTPQDKLVMHSAIVLAGLGITLSSFSVKQLLATKRQN
ncbi:hypothetical protein J6590_043706 [Homalodisca vitripennis]|nr:hypothetical protein J6590_043706 [Homalodisca vitripennis]